MRAKQSHRPSLALQERDLELLQTTAEYRLISTPHYLRLFESESGDGIYRRLQRLFHHGYLERVGRNPNAPLVYALARRGAEILGVPLSKRVGEPYALHQLMVSDIRVGVTIAARASGIEVTWRRVPRDLPVQPDGFFGLRFPNRPDGANRAFFFLEADRSTMPRGRYIEKLSAYQAWHAGGGHTTALGIKTFRVLTVTKSHERLGSLLTTLEGEPRLAERRTAYWFATVADASLRAFEVIWLTAVGDGCPRSILPPVGA